MVVQLRTSSAVDLLRYACSPRIIPMSTNQINSSRCAARAGVPCFATLHATSLVQTSKHVFKLSAQCRSFDLSGPGLLYRKTVVAHQDC